ncbi:hypothetical protein [Bradyrhizobium japonicum]|uniref:hypothetical protein n=1 Tax=Bradyrhizobium TaxID=374 RepID=UPI00117C9D77|nr:hypothetical protein [Bradyrhizobium japonicum]
MKELRSISCVTRKQAESARETTPWSLTNEILYRLCREHPYHTDEQVILAKLNIIGRVYATAIERRKVVSPGETNDKFYLERVAPAIMKSGLDKWISQAKSVAPYGSSALPVMLEIHKRTTDLFGQITELNKRSLASKYLHFHVPTLFFIYDSRANRGIRSLSFPESADEKTQYDCDPTYRVFVLKCVTLRSYCESRFGIRMSPRDLDNLLLAISP